MKASVWGYLAVVVVAGVAACGQPEPEQADDDVASAEQGVTAVGKIRTPSGEFDMACVHEVPNGGSVDADGNVMQNGRQVARVLPCLNKQPLVMPRLTKPGLQAPTTNGWVEASWANATTISGLTYYNSLNATFTVPSAPSVAGGQLIYLFPSIEANGAAILQPVLQWGNNGWFGGNYWTLASWYVDSSTALFSTPVTVNAGDSITGVIRLTGTGSTKNTWIVTGTDTTSGASTGTAFSTTTTPFNSAQQGVLEAYRVTSCSHYPAAGDIIFTNVTGTQAGPSWNNYNAVTPSWFPAYSTVTPACDFQVSNFTSGGGTGTTLFF